MGLNVFSNLTLEKLITAGNPILESFEEKLKAIMNSSVFNLPKAPMASLPLFGREITGKRSFQPGSLGDVLSKEQGAAQGSQSLKPVDPNATASTTTTVSGTNTGAVTESIGTGVPPPTDPYGSKAEDLIVIEDNEESIAS